MKGVVYKITGRKDGEEMIYIGSTTQSLKQRLQEHKCNYKNNMKCRSTLLFKTYGVDNCVIEVLDEWEGEDEKDLRWLERKWVENIPCVNKKRPIITEEERKEEMKEYGKEYREQNKEYMKEYCKKYHKTYYEQNKESMKQKQRERYRRKKTIEIIKTVLIKTTITELL